MKLFLALLIFCGILTGQKPNKDAENGLFFAETGVILTSE